MRVRLEVSVLVSLDFTFDLSNAVSNSEPDDDPNVRGDSLKTLFVARLSYDATEKDLEKEFGRFGPIERIRIVTDTTAETNGHASDVDSKPPKQQKKKKKPHRGYAFIVYEREKDMKGRAPLPLNPHSTNFLCLGLVG